MVDFWDIVRSNPETFLVVPDDDPCPCEAREHDGSRICGGCYHLREGK